MTMFDSEQRLTEWLTKDIRSEDPGIREDALDRLGSLSGDYSEIIAGELTDPDPEVRASAAANLGAVRRTAAWPHLVAVARTESSDDVLQHVVQALSGYDNQAILDLLLELLNQRERDYRIRMKAVIQLWKYDVKVASRMLSVIMFANEHPLVRMHAADSMEILDELSARDLERQEFWTRLTKDDDLVISEIARGALDRPTAKTASDIVVTIARRLQHPEKNERSRALYRVSMLGGETAITYAAPLLEDDQMTVRVAACRCLGAIRDERTIPKLVAVLRGDPDADVRQAAALALENYRAIEIGDVAVDLLQTGRLPGKTLAILYRQLWKYPSHLTTQLLQTALNSSVELPYRADVENTLLFLRRM
jgi:HEAT repeat protein